MTTDIFKNYINDVRYNGELYIIEPVAGDIKYNKDTGLYSVNGRIPAKQYSIKNMMRGHKALQDHYDSFLDEMEKLHGLLTKWKEETPKEYMAFLCSGSNRKLNISGLEQFSTESVMCMLRVIDLSDGGVDLDDISIRSEGGLKITRNGETIYLFCTIDCIAFTAQAECGSCIKWSHPESTARAIKFSINYYPEVDKDDIKCAEIYNYFLKQIKPGSPEIGDESIAMSPFLHVGVKYREDIITDKILELFNRYAIDAEGGKNIDPVEYRELRSAIADCRRHEILLKDAEKRKSALIRKYVTDDNETAWLGDILIQKSLRKTKKYNMEEILKHLSTFLTEAELASLVEEKSYSYTKVKLREEI